MSSDYVTEHKKESDISVQNQAFNYNHFLQIYTECENKASSFIKHFYKTFLKISFTKFTFDNLLLKQ